MKKFITFLITLIFMISVITTWANTILPICISEVYWEEEEWYIELSDYYGMITIYFEDITFTCSEGSSSFSGYQFLPPGCTIVITKENLEIPLNLNHENDFIDFGIYGSVAWGEPSNNQLQAPLPGQSIKGRIVLATDPWSSTHAVYCLDSTPSIGDSPYIIDSRATLEIQAYDINSEPSPEFGIQFAEWEDDIPADENGFINLELFAKMYRIIGKCQEETLLDTIVSLYPDSLLHLDIYTNYDPLLADPNETLKPVYNISNSPNPFNPVTTISFGRVLEQPAQVKIYNSKGGLVEELYCNSGKESISWNAGTTASGVYFYKLEVEGSEVGNGKMLLLK